MKRLAVGIGLLCAAALAAASGAAASTIYVVQGRGWGHGIGMSQWGAYGYARHGWSYPRILRHYYPGTSLGRTAPRSVRVLVGEGATRDSLACAAPLTATDGAGHSHRLAAGSYMLGPRLVLPVGARRVRVHGKTHRTHRHHARFRTVAVRRALPQPVTFDCPAAPLTLNASAYHGELVLYRWGGRLAAVNKLSLEAYLRGVVGGEMPSHWSLAALEAQAVAARTYALATLKPNGAFDLYDDTRSQVYGGIAYETPRTNLAVARTTGRIVTWQGRPAATFFFSTSGGRTAAIRDVWPAAQPLPYLRSVSDPYDARSPHHRWGPIAVTPAELAAHLGTPAPAPGAGVGVIRNGSGRAATVEIGRHRIPAAQVEKRLGLGSTWFRFGVLSLRAATSRLVFGNAVVLRGAATGIGRAKLQARTAGGRWRTLRVVPAGRFALAVHPSATTRYRLASRGVSLAPVAVAVAPRLRVEALAPGRLAGLVRPRTRTPIVVSRRTAHGWRVVARPRLDARGRFSLPLRLDRELRVTVAAGRSLASAQTHLRPRLRYLASVGP